METRPDGVRRVIEADRQARMEREVHASINREAEIGATILRMMTDDRGRRRAAADAAIEEAKRGRRRVA